MSRYRASPRVRVVNWPLRDQGLRTWLVAAVFGAGVFISWRISGSGAMAAFCLAVLVIASWRMWVPVTFEMNNKGITQSALGIRRRVPWTQIARCEIRRQGVLLLADAEMTPLSPLRSLFVRWNRQQDEIVDAVDFFLSRRQRISMSTTRTFNGERGQE